MWKCAKCGETILEFRTTCPKCGGGDVAELPEVDEPDIAAGPLVHESKSGRPGTPSIIPKDSPRPASEHAMANALVWVFRILAGIGGIWGLYSIFSAFQGYAAMSDALNRIGAGSMQREMADMAGMQAVFTAIVSGCAAVAFPLGMAEIIRLCVLIEANSRASAQDPAKR